MTVTPSLRVVTRFAEQEALAARFAEVEPEHFLLALLKFAELPASQVQTLVPDLNLNHGGLATDVEAVRTRLAALRIATTHARRRLRARLGTCPVQTAPRAPLPSEASRSLFRVAEALAGMQTGELSAPQLLEATLHAPTPAMGEVFGALPDFGPITRETSPLLATCGRDIRALPAKELVGHRQSQAACRAILSTAERDRKRLVFVVASNLDAVRQVLQRVAEETASPLSPPAVQRRWLWEIDLAAALQSRPDGETEAAMAALVAELARAGLLVPVLHDWFPGVADPSGAALVAAADAGAARWLCPLPVERAPGTPAWAQDLAVCPALAEQSRAVFIDESFGQEVPWEI